MNPKYNVRAMLEDFLSQVGKENGIDGWDVDLLALIEELYAYTLTLEERIEKLEDARK